VHFAKYIHNCQLTQNYWDLFSTHFANLKTRTPAQQNDIYSNIKFQLGLLEDVDNGNQIEEEDGDGSEDEEEDGDEENEEVEEDEEDEEGFDEDNGADDDSA
ncbi:hypothetical protein HDU78_008537, partial [Chytriomyces hyalinus]